MTCQYSAVYCSNYILDLLEGSRKLLVFAHHKVVLDAICDCLHEKVSYSAITVECKERVHG